MPVFDYIAQFRVPVDLWLCNDLDEYLAGATWVSVLSDYPAEWEQGPSSRWCAELLHLGWEMEEPLG